MLVWCSHALPASRSSWHSGEAASGSPHSKLQRSRTRQWHACTGGRLSWWSHMISLVGQGATQDAGHRLASSMSSAVLPVLKTGQAAPQHSQRKYAILSTVPTATGPRCHRLGLRGAIRCTRDIRAHCARYSSTSRACKHDQGKASETTQVGR